MDPMKEDPMTRLDLWAEALREARAMRSRAFADDQRRWQAMGVLSVAGLLGHPDRPGEAPLPSWSDERAKGCPAW